MKVLLETHHKFYCSTSQIDAISSEECICQKATKESKEKGCSHEIGNVVGRTGWRKMHEFWHVEHKIACIGKVC